MSIWLQKSGAGTRIQKFKPNKIHNANHKKKKGNLGVTFDLGFSPCLGGVITQF